MLLIVLGYEAMLSRIDDTPPCSVKATNKLMQYNDKLKRFNATTINNRRTVYYRKKPLNKQAKIIEYPQETR